MQVNISGLRLGGRAPPSLPPEVPHHVPLSQFRGSCCRSVEVSLCFLSEPESTGFSTQWRLMLILCVSDGLHLSVILKVKYQNSIEAALLVKQETSIFCQMKTLRNSKLFSGGTTGGQREQTGTCVCWFVVSQWCMIVVMTTGKLTSRQTGSGSGIRRSSFSRSFHFRLLWTSSSTFQSFTSAGGSECFIGQMMLGWQPIMQVLHSWV